MDIVLNFAILLGIATWLPGLAGYREAWLGARFLFASFAVILALFLGNVLATIPLTIVAWAIAAVAAAGLVNAARKLIADRTNGVRRAIWSMNHPVWGFPVVLAVVAVAKPEISYQPYLGDELASWLRLARQVFLADAYWSDAVEYHLGAYTDGWPLLVAFPSLFYKTFSETHAASIQFFMHVGLIGLIFDAARWIAREEGVEDHRVILLFSWLGVLVFLTAEASWLLFPTDLLIDRPLLYVFAACLILALLAQYGNVDRLRVAIALGAAFAAGYLLKVAALALGLAFGVFWLSFAVRDALEGKSLGRTGAVLLRRAGLSAIAMLAPLAVVYAVWSVRRTGVDCQANLGAFLAGDFSLLAGDKGISLAGTMRDMFLAYASEFKFPLTLISIAALLWGLFTRRLAPLVIGFAIFAATYFAALYVSYAFCESSLTSGELDSIQRYTRVPLRLVHILGLVFIGIAALRVNTLFRRRGVDLGERLYANDTTRVILMMLLAAGMAWQMVSLDRSLTDITTRKYQAADNIALVGRVKRDSERLIAALAARGIDYPKVVLIDQGGYNVALNVARYYAIKTVRDGAYFYYETAQPYSWHEGAPRPHSMATTTPDLAADLARAAVIWPVTIDPWIIGVLTRLPGVGACAGDLNSHFLIKNASGAFDCVAKR